MAPEDKKADDVHWRHPLILMGSPEVTVHDTKQIVMFTHMLQTPVTDDVPHSINPRRTVEFHFGREQTA